MTEDYSEMSEAELIELQRKIEKELAERKQANKPEKLPSQKPRVEKPKIKAPPFEQMSALFCRKCGHPIWEFTTEPPGYPRGNPISYFFVKKQSDKPVEVTHCPKCKRKLSPGRLKLSDELEAAIYAISEHPKQESVLSGTLEHKYCVECDHKIGLLLNSNPPQFFDEWDRHKPISSCPICHTPLKEADDVDFNDKQRNVLASVYGLILQWAQEKPVLESELAQLFEKIKAKRAGSLEGVKTIIGVYANEYGRDKTSLKEQLTKCQDYCDTNKLEVIEKLMYSYQSSDRKLKLDKLHERKIGAIVATMNWLTSHSLNEAVVFVRELEQAGIHLEIIGKQVNQD